MSNDFRSAGRTVTVVYGRVRYARARPKCMTEEKCFKTTLEQSYRELQHKVSVFREFQTVGASNGTRGRRSEFW